MTDEPTSKNPINPPSKSRVKALSRGIVEGVADLVPGASILTNILTVTHPSGDDNAQEVWQEEISSRTNENTSRIENHSKLLQPEHKTVSGTTAALINKLANACPDGLGLSQYTLEDMINMLPQEKVQDVEDAAYELENYGLIEINRFLSGDWYAHLNPVFYEALDYQIMGWDTEKDAVSIAKIMLENKTGDAATLHQKCGWKKRRFNPAFRMVANMFPEGRVQRTLQPDYPTLGVCIAPEDRVMLKSFIAGV